MNWNMRWAIISMVASLTALVLALMSIAGSRRIATVYAPKPIDLTQLCASFERWKQITGDDEPGMTKRCKGE